MRINLVTPFAEKDAVKALGARWDSAKKTWYIQNVADLTPFQRWMPGGAAPADGAASAAAAAGSAAPRTQQASPKQSTGGTFTGPATIAPHCGCKVLPWEPCAHSP